VTDPRPQRCVRRRRGFTLIEALMASVIFLLGMAGTMPMMFWGVKFARGAHDLNTAVETVHLVVDRLQTGRVLGLEMGGPGGVPSTVIAAPESGATCFFLSTEDAEAPQPDDCTEVGDNVLVSRAEVDSKFQVAWTLEQERALPGAPVIDRLVVEVAWRSADDRVHRVQSNARVVR
jgi:prepilin-type N-terminal cleavage/methylation domain-containing protein